MTKIKKSIYSAVVAVVMSLALVFGVFAGVNANRTAKAEYDEEKVAQQVTEFKFVMTNFFAKYGMAPNKGGFTTEMLDNDTKYTYQVDKDDPSTAVTYKLMEAYNRALVLYTELKSYDDDETVVDKPLESDYFAQSAATLFETIKAMVDSLDQIIADISGNEENQLGYMLARETHYYTCSFMYNEVEGDPSTIVTVNDLENGVVYGDTAKYQEVQNAFDALDTHQQEYVRRQTNRGYNLYAVSAALAVANEKMADVKNKSTALAQKADNGVLYSYKQEYDALVEKYTTELDPTAQADENLLATYGLVSGLNVVFADIEAKAAVVDEKLAAMLYWSQTAEAMVTDDAEYSDLEIVVDSQDSVDAVIDAFNAIYNGRVVTVGDNNFTVANLKAFYFNEEDKLATEWLDGNEFTKLCGVLNPATEEGYFAKGEVIVPAYSTLLGYQKEAANVEAKVVALEVTADAHYKTPAKEKEINDVYGEYDALNTPNYDGHNNKQKYMAEENRAKIEGIKNTLDTLNAWIRKVATLVDSKNNNTLTAESTVADVDGVINWALENNFEFDVKDYQSVKDRIDEYTLLVTNEDETTDTIKVNALANAREVLRVLQGKIEDAIEHEAEKVVELKNLLASMADLLDGVKYADKVTYDYFETEYRKLSEDSQNELQNDENWGNKVALGEALDLIAGKVADVKELLDAIQYRFVAEVTDENPTGYEMDVWAEGGEIVVASAETVDAAQAAMEVLYNGTTGQTQGGVDYKIATLEYVYENGTRWAEDVVENENAFLHFGVADLTEEDFVRYEAAVAKIAELRAAAQEVDTGIANLEITNYRAQREAIETLYNAYEALDKGYYNNAQVWVTSKTKNNLTIVEAHEILEELDAWVLDVASAIDEYNEPQQLGQEPTVAEVDTLINGTNKDDVKLTLVEIEYLLGKYDEVTDYDAELKTRDAVKEVSVKEAHDLLVYRKEAIETAIENVKKELEDLGQLLKDGVKYSDTEKYEELVQKLEELDPSAEEELDITNLETLRDALDEIERRAMALGRLIDSMQYRFVTEVTDETPKGYKMDTWAEGGVVVAESRASIEAVQEAVKKVYNGYECYVESDEQEEEPVLLYRLANLEYPWTADAITYVNDNEEEVTVNAFVYYFAQVDVAGYYARYDAAVTALDALKELAANLQKDIEEQLIDVLSVDNHYRTLRTNIVSLYERYQALADYVGEKEVRGEFDNLQPWVTRVVLDEQTEEPTVIEGGKAIANAYDVLEALEAWREAVAVAIDGYNDPKQLSEQPTLEEVDELIAGTNKEDVKLTLTQVEGLLANYATVTAQDPIKVAAVADAYALLDYRQTTINNDKTTLLEKIATMSTENVTYKAKPAYDELKAEYDRLVALEVEFDAEETANLTLVGNALAEIERRTSALKEAIDNILYYIKPVTAEENVEPEGDNQEVDLDEEDEEEEDVEDPENPCMVKDSTGAVVYDTRASLLLAKEAIEAVYPLDGQDNIAKLGVNWFLTEDGEGNLVLSDEAEAFLAVYAEKAGITVADVAEYVRVFTEYKALEDAAKAVAQRIVDLTITVEDHFKAQEADINQLLLDLANLTHAEVLHDHNNWVIKSVLVEEDYVTIHSLDLDGNVIFTEQYIEKIYYVYMMVCAVNKFDCKVANFVTGAEVADPDNSLTAEIIKEIDNILLQYADVDLTKVYTYDVKTLKELLDSYNNNVNSFDVEDEFNLFPTVDKTEYKDAYVAAVEPAKTVLDKYYVAARKLNNDLVEIIVDICEKNEKVDGKSLSEDDEKAINTVKEIYEQLTWSQKAILENDYENHYEPFVDEDGEEYGGYYWTQDILDGFYNDEWDNIGEYTIEEFFNIAERFDGANYYKQAVAELVTQLGETYFTVEGYVLEKGLLAMYYTFDNEMKAMVESAYQHLLSIDAAYKEVNRDDYTSYTSVTEDLEGQIVDAKTDLENAQAALEADIIEALGVENVETVKAALEAYKDAVGKAQNDLEAAQEALVNSITNSLDPEAQTVEAAFDTYKNAVKDAQDELEAAQEALVAEIKTALGEEEAESVQAALKNYKEAVEKTQDEQAQTQAEAAKAAEDTDKENDEKVAQLKKALIITAVAGGVVAVAAAVCIIALFAKMSALGGAAAGSSAAGSAAAGEGAEGGKEE